MREAHDRRSGRAQIIANSQRNARSRIGRRLGRAAALALSVAVLAGCKEEDKYVPPPPPQVGVAKPLQQAVTPYLEQTGNTAAYNMVDLVARVEGFLNRINYTDGAPAKAGDTLFVI